VNELRERLAALEHDQWCAWAQSILATEAVSPERRARWKGLFLPYDELSEEMKDHDRLWADKVLALLWELS
jgi:hypothetical protein